MSGAQQTPLGAAAWRDGDYLEMGGTAAVHLSVSGSKFPASVIRNHLGIMTAKTTCQVEVIVSWVLCLYTDVEQQCPLRHPRVLWRLTRQKTTSHSSFWRPGSTNHPHKMPREHPRVLSGLIRVPLLRILRIWGRTPLDKSFPRNLGKCTIANWLRRRYFSCDRFTARDSVQYM